jgi:hypothetical protein
MALTQKQKEQFNKAVAWKLGVNAKSLNYLFNMTEEDKLNLISEWKTVKQMQLASLNEDINNIKEEI